MTTKNIDNYNNSMGKMFLDEKTRFPLGVLDDFVIDSKNLKIEGFLIRNGFFNELKVIKSFNVNRWSEDLFVSGDSIKELGFYDQIKNILIKGNSVIWKKVVTETGETIGRVYNLIFSNSSFIGLSIVVRKSFFGLFFYGKDRIISKKNILNINLNEVVIRDKSIIKV